MWKLYFEDSASSPARELSRQYDSEEAAFRAVCEMLKDPRFSVLRIEGPHNDYNIEVLKESQQPDRWRARIRRLDGTKIKVFADDSICPEVMMPDEFSADKAIKQAKNSINAGAFSKAPEE